MQNNPNNRLPNSGLSGKGLYRWILSLTAPIALQNIITYSVGLADNLMVGSQGELALSGVYVANQLQGNCALMLMVVMAAFRPACNPGG
jgi:Na+-driven multidrug efflux pump